MYGEAMSTRYTFAGQDAEAMLARFQALLEPAGYVIHGRAGPITLEERSALVDEFLLQYRIPEF